MVDALSPAPSALSLITNFPDVGGEGVECLELAGMRTLERDLQIRQEGVVGRDIHLTAAARGDWRHPGSAFARGVDQEILTVLPLRAPLERRAERDADE